MVEAKDQKGDHVTLLLVCFCWRLVLSFKNLCCSILASRMPAYACDCHVMLDFSACLSGIKSVTLMVFYLKWNETKEFVTSVSVHFLCGWIAIACRLASGHFINLRHELFVALWSYSSFCISWCFALRRCQFFWDVSMKGMDTQSWWRIEMVGKVFAILCPFRYWVTWCRWHQASNFMLIMARWSCLW